MNAVEESPQGEPETEVGGLFICGICGEDEPNVEVNSMVKVGVDSCAGILVLPSTMCQDYLLEESAASRVGVEYYPAWVNTSVRNLGARTISCDVEG